MMFLSDKHFKRCIKAVAGFSCCIFLVLQSVLSWGQETGVWIENLGQLQHTDNTPAHEVLYYASLHHMNVYITTEGISYVLLENSDKEEEEEEHKESIYALLQAIKENERRKFTRRFRSDNRHEAKLVRYHRIDVLLRNATVTSKGAAFKVSDQGKLNFYNVPQHRNGISNVREFDSLVIPDIYPGIDWSLYFIKSQHGEVHLKQDFIVKPFADPQQIALQVKGAKFHLAEGNTRIILHSKSKEVDLGKLYTFQEGRHIAGFYELNNETIIHRIGKYNPAKELIVDPELIWSTYYGGNLYEGLTAATIDRLGNMYMTGYTSSSDFPVQPGRGYFLSENTGRFLLKFNPMGKRIYATWYSGVFNDLAIDRDFNLYAVGRYGDSTSVQTLPGAFNQPSVSGIEALIVKFDSSGRRIWGTFFGGTSEIHSISVDSTNSFYIGGITNETDFPRLAPNGEYLQGNIPSSNDQDGFISKFSANGRLLWSTNLGHAGMDVVTAVKVDRLNRLYAVGCTEKAQFPLVQVSAAYHDHQPTNIKSFIIRFDQNNKIEWSTLFGGSSNSALTIYTLITDLGFDQLNNLYFTGETELDNLPVLAQPHAYNKAGLSGTKDGFIAKFDALGKQLWTSYFGGSGSEDHIRLSVDCEDRIYIAGEVSSDVLNTFPKKKNLHPLSYFDSSYGSDNNDAFITRFNRDSIDWSTILATDDRDFSADIAIYGSRVLVAGEHFQAGAEVIAPDNKTFVQQYTGTTGFSDFPDECMIKLFKIARPSRIDTVKTCSFPINLNVDSNNRYAACIWNDGQVRSARTVVAPGIFYVEKIDSKGCSYIDSFVVIDMNRLRLNLGRDTTLCKGTSYILNASNPGATYTWSNSETTASITIREAGTYWVRASDEAGCSKTDTIIIDYTQPEVKLGADTVLCPPSRIRLNVFYPDAQYLWQDGTRSSVYEVSKEGVYHVTVTINTDCAVSDTIRIQEESCDNILVPTAFSPNGDGLNDQFRIIHKGRLHLGYLNIYDRWGNQVYSSRNINDGWDGTYKGQDCEMGTYFFDLSITSYITRKTYYEKGTISLIR